MVDIYSACTAFGSKSIGRAEITDSYTEYSWTLIRRYCTDGPWISNLVATTPPYKRVTWQSPKRCVIIPVASDISITYDKIKEKAQVVISDGEVFARALLEHSIGGICRKTAAAMLNRNGLLVKSCQVFPCNNRMKSNFEYQLSLEASLKIISPPFPLIEISDSWENTSVTNFLKILFHSRSIEFAWETMNSKGGLSADVTECLKSAKPKLLDHLLRNKSTREQNSCTSFWMNEGNGHKYFWIVDNHSGKQTETSNGNSALNHPKVHKVNNYGGKKRKLSNSVLAQENSPDTVTHELIAPDHNYFKPNAIRTDCVDNLHPTQHHCTINEDCQIVANKEADVPRIISIQEDSFIVRLNKLAAKVKSKARKRSNPELSDRNEEMDVELSPQSESRLKDEITSQLFWAFKCTESEDEDDT